MHIALVKRGKAEIDKRWHRRSLQRYYRKITTGMDTAEKKKTAWKLSRKRTPRQETEQDEAHRREEVATGSFTYRNLARLEGRTKDDAWNPSKGRSGWKRRR